MYIYYIPNQWSVFFVHSDWLLNSDGICHSPPGIVLEFAWEFFLIFQKKKEEDKFGTGCLMFILEQLFSPCSVGEEW